MYWLLFYDVVDDYLERRGAFRSAHLALAREAYQRGEIVMAGALAEPADGAVFVFHGDTDRVASDFAAQDPYVLNGLVSDWKVRQWTVVIGQGVEPPV